MNKTEKELLNIIQTDFPLESRPYQKLANDLGITEEQVIAMIGELKENGSIKRIGGIFNSKELGYYSTLCAASVPVEKITEAAEIINSYQGVTHNYIRNHEFNMWFTIIAPSMGYIEKFIGDIKLRTGIERIINLPAVKLFKINVNFDMRD
ncbi:MAG TPA: hypothetical protein VM577_11440 [Anaerovoracaceae bacterium]|nr:hypothetical protein [Anaerovoracaceae bacterium]